jgi:hypothetical protein
VLGAEFATERKDEAGALSTKTDREVMCEVIAKAKPGIDLAERSDEYVRAIFDQTVEACTKADAATAALGAATAPKVDPPKSRLDESLAKLAKETADLAKAGPPPGAITRK